MMNRRTFFGLSAGAALGSLDLRADLKPGQPAKELVIALNSGEQLLLSKFKGQVVVLEFLLTTCSHCQKCSSTMQKLYAEFNGAFQPLGAAINPQDMTQARALIPQYIYSLGLKFPVGWTKNDMAYQWLDIDTSKGNVYFPQVVIIDKKGLIHEYHPGADQQFFEHEETNLRNTITRLLKDGPARAGK